MVLTNAQVVEAFGDPTPYVLSDGHVSTRWENAILTTFVLPAPIPLAGHPETEVRRITCHHQLSLPVQSVFANLYRGGHWDKLTDYGGCYCWRTQRAAPTARSRHCWGIALDVNVADNHFLGASHMPAEVIDAFKAQGFVWGGDWQHRPDPMHFEFVDIGRLA